MSKMGIFNMESSDLPEDLVKLGNIHRGLGTNHIFISRGGKVSHYQWI